MMATMVSRPRRMFVGACVMGVLSAQCLADPTAEIIGALRSLSEAWELHESDHPIFFDIAGMGVAQARIGDIQGATHTLTRLGDYRERERSAILFEIAMHQARGGKVTAAIDAAAPLRPWRRMDVWLTVGMVQWHKENRRTAKDLFEEVRLAAERENSTYVSAAFLSRLALACAGCGNTQDGTKYVEQAAKIGRSGKLSDRPIDLALAAWKLGKQELAYTFLSEIRTEATKALAMHGKLGAAARLGRIAVAQAKLGRHGDALETIGRIPPGTTKERTLRELANGQVEAGEYTAAIRTAKRIVQYDDWREKLFTRIVRRLADAGKWRESRELLEDVTNSSRRAEGLLCIASARIRQGHMRIGLKLAGSVDLHMQAGGNLSRGHETATRFDFQDPRTWGLRYNYDGFISMTLDIHNKELARDLASATMRLYQHIEHIKEEDQHFDRIFAGFPPRVVRGLAKAHAEAGDPHEALLWAVKMKSLAKRAAAILGIVDAVTGDHKESW